MPQQKTHPGLAAEIGQRLFDRLDGLVLAPQSVVDLGAGTGTGTAVLAERFGQARVVAVDGSWPMLHQARRASGRWRKRFDRVCGDARALPLAAASVDLLFSNLMVHRCEDPTAVLNGFRRVLRPGGLLLVSVLGPDTLIEARNTPGNDAKTPAQVQFLHAQALGDALMRAGFSEPVLDTDWITRRCRSASELVADAVALGAISTETQAAFQTALARSADQSGTCTATWEVVYGSAWGPEEGAPVRTVHGEEASISIARIGRRRRRD